MDDGSMATPMTFPIDTPLGVEVVGLIRDRRVTLAAGGAIGLRRYAPAAGGPLNPDATK